MLKMNTAKKLFNPHHNFPGPGSIFYNIIKQIAATKALSKLYASLCQVNIFKTVNNKFNVLIMICGEFLQV